MLLWRSLLQPWEQACRLTVTVQGLYTHLPKYQLTCPIVHAHKQGVRNTAVFLITPWLTGIILLLCII